MLQSAAGEIESNSIWAKEPDVVGGGSAKVSARFTREPPIDELISRIFPAELNNFACQSVGRAMFQFGDPGNAADCHGQFSDRPHRRLLRPLPMDGCGCGYAPDARSFGLRRR